MNEAERDLLRVSLRRRGAEVARARLLLWAGLRRSDTDAVAEPQKHAELVGRYRQAVDALYDPEWRENLRLLQEGDVLAVDWAVTFLEANPRCFGAGYATERILRYLSRVPLAADPRDRLRAVIVRAVLADWVNASRVSERGLKEVFLHADPSARWEVGPQAVPREFVAYGRLARSLHDDVLSNRVTELAKDRNPAVRHRAQRILGS